MRMLILVAVLGLVACGGDTVPNWPDVETLYRVEGDVVVCDSPVYRTEEPSGGPFTKETCHWENILYRGSPRCWAEVWFTRPNASSPWSAPEIITTGATCY